MSAPVISVVIPSYNRRDCVLALLTDIFRQQDISFEVIVVDDCSLDDSVATIRREFPQVTLLVNEKNGGPCVSRNRGIRAARGEFIVGFDSDVTVPDISLLAKVASRFRGQPAAGLAFRLLKPDGKSEDALRWWHPLPIGENADRSFSTSYFSGTGYAFRRKEVIEAGIFPEILYMHYEEVELAFRILDNGGEILYCPDLPVLHHAHPVSRRSEIEVYYKPRNQILIAAMTLPAARAVAYLGPRMAYQFFKACRGGHLKDFARAVHNAVRMMPKCLNVRKPLRKSTFESLKSMKVRKTG